MAYTPFILRKENKEQLTIDENKNHPNKHDIVIDLSHNEFFKLVYGKYEHIGNKLLELAGNPAFDDYINILINDTRDGTRKGFPEDVGTAIMKLSRIHDELIEKYNI